MRADVSGRIVALIVFLATAAAIPVCAAQSANPVTGATVEAGQSAKETGKEIGKEPVKQRGRTPAKKSDVDSVKANTPNGPQPSVAVRRVKPAADIKETSVPLGRIPLQSGTFGFDAGTKSNAREFPDGRRLPAYEALKREGGLPFIGLSLSVPTSSIPLFSGSTPRSTD